MTELISKGMPQGKEVVQEGIKIGNTFAVGRSAFLEHRNVRCESDWKIMQAEKGNIQWDPLLGLSTLDEQVAGIKTLWEWGKEKGIEIDRCGHIWNMLNGLPPDKRGKVPKPTSFLVAGLEDFKRLSQAAPMQPRPHDHVIGTPNSVDNTINCLKTGVNYIGTLAQHVWDYPYWNDDVAQEIETIKALGVMTSKRKDGAVVTSYIGDGIPSQLLDHASEIGYMLIEKYVVQDLCGAAFAGCLGGVHSHIPGKLATWLALHDVLKSDDHCGMCHFEGQTLETTKDFASNYALVVTDFIPFAILERKYKTGAHYSAKPVTEAVRVPTLPEIIDALSVCVVALRKALEFEEANLIDDSYINKLRAILVEQGKQFFKNSLKGLSDMGVDIKDPLQVLLAVRRLGGAKLEEMAHPGERDSSRLRGIVPFAPTDLFKKPMAELDRIVNLIRSEHLDNVVRDKKIVLGSTDTHEFGLLVLDSVLNTFGAKVINGGVELDVEPVLDLAFREGTPYICMSTHNGLCLEWGRHLVNVAKQRNQRVDLFMGGKLNTILETATEPVDVSDKLEGLGIIPCREVADLFKAIANIKVAKG